MEDGLHFFQIRPEESHQLHLFLLQIRHDDLPLQQTFERVEQLERGADGDAVLEPLDDDTAQSTFELLDARAKLVKVVVEVLRLHVHDIVLNL